MDDELIVGLYARVSSQQQADEQTIDSQVDSLRKRIRDDGQTLDAELCFLDEGYSGEVLLRPRVGAIARHGLCRRPRSHLHLLA